MVGSICLFQLIFDIEIDFWHCNCIL